MWIGSWDMTIKIYNSVLLIFLISDSFFFIELLTDSRTQRTTHRQHQWHHFCLQLRQTTLVCMGFILRLFHHTLAAARCPSSRRKTTQGSLTHGGGCQRSTRLWNHSKNCSCCPNSDRQSACSSISSYISPPKKSIFATHSTKQTQFTESYSITRPPITSNSQQMVQRLLVLSSIRSRISRTTPRQCRWERKLLFSPQQLTSWLFCTFQSCRQSGTSFPTQKVELITFFRFGIWSSNPADQDF